MHFSNYFFSLRSLRLGGSLRQAAPRLRSKIDFGNIVLALTQAY
jgi:hypothetical protein